MDNPLRTKYLANAAPINCPSHIESDGYRILASFSLYLSLDHLKCALHHYITELSKQTRIAHIGTRSLAEHMVDGSNPVRVVGFFSVFFFN